MLLVIFFISLAFQVTRQQIVSKILSVKDLLKECEVNEGEEGIFLERWTPELSMGTPWWLKNLKK